MNKILIALLLVSFAAQGQAATVKRNDTFTRQFRKTHVCPATNTIQSTCPGYVVDHIIPLCAGGADDPVNMQYQTTSDSYKKDTWERALCAKLRKCELPNEYL